MLLFFHFTSLYFLSQEKRHVFYVVGREKRSVFYVVGREKRGVFSWLAPVEVDLQQIMIPTPILMQMSTLISMPMFMLVCLARVFDFDVLVSLSLSLSLSHPVLSLST